MALGVSGQVSLQGSAHLFRPSIVAFTGSPGSILADYANCGEAHRQLQLLSAPDASLLHQFLMALPLGVAVPLTEGDEPDSGRCQPEDIGQVCSR